MKRLLISFALTCFAAFSAYSQVSASEITGVWAIAAIEKSGEDTVLLFTKDSAVEKALADKKCLTIDDVAKKLKDDEKMAVMFLKIMETMFLQFSGADDFTEGSAKDRTFKAAKMSKKGKYTISIDGLVLTTAMGTEGNMNSKNYNINMHNGLLMVSNENTGMVMLMKKVSVSPRF